MAVIFVASFVTLHVWSFLANQGGAPPQPPSPPLGLGLKLVIAAIVLTIGAGVIIKTAGRAQLSAADYRLLTDHPTTAR